MNFYMIEIEMEKDNENINIIYELINGNGRVKEYNDNIKLLFEG